MNAYKLTVREEPTLLTRRRFRCQARCSCTIPLHRCLWMVGNQIHRRWSASAAALRKHNSATFRSEGIGEVFFSEYIGSKEA
mmetsp:Transcript_20614/g.43188  ORF Transcript_20614/g.43188 Transcript_20614/m.43188 type:complete len:82 (+) Transcript_20614:359-604(+)